MIDLSLQKHAFLALGAAMLFGLSTPLAKLLLGDLPPVALAGLLYLGSGAGLLLARLLQRAADTPTAAREAPLTRRDLPWLGGAVVAGGVVAPVLLLWGLRGTGASAASLLLNLEGVITTLLAAALFHEAIARRVWIATLLMALGGVLLSWQPGAGGGWSLQSLAIAGACLFWGLDNNLTRRVAAADPVLIAMLKGLVAGSCNLALAIALGMALPPAVTVVAALVLGFLSYGVSLVLFIYALRHLGSARAGAHFSTAPFIGAAVAILALGEPFTALFALALLLMAAATWLVLSEQHAHAHTHEAQAHSHRHIHDAHHQHAHPGAGGDGGAEPHVHRHEHAPLGHTHAHLPDLHHRHRH